MARLDPHSYADETQARTRHVDWEAEVDFAARALTCAATLHLDGVSPGALDLDSRGLDIQRCEDAGGRLLQWAQHPADPILGSRIEVQLRADTRLLRIRYRVAQGASALQWLSPEQTAGGRHPFLFSQCQAIHARSIVPLQDSPKFRVTWSVKLTVPASLRALVAARHDGREELGERAVERYTMPQPIPPYLLAFAVGDLAARELGPRSRVWAEPEVVEAAASEFEGVEQMIAAAEGLFGPYDWERFDLLVMPPSFPYGGMENPRLTFLTPTLLTGDRSQVNVVAHELAHSWTGNLVTNASAEHFWLNEGWTVYAERRLLEALEGRERSELHAALGRAALEEALAQFGDKPAMTRLVTELWGVDPDEVFSVVPYEKGYLFLRALEEAVGRAAFDPFVRRYVDAHRFGALDTEEFLAFARRELPSALAAVDVPAWIHGEGLLPGAPRATSARLAEVRQYKDTVPPAEVSSGWTATEVQLFLDALSRPANAALLDAVDARFALGQSPNTELRVAWLELALVSGRDVLDSAAEVLAAVGRIKYVKPLYGALAQRAETRGHARELFEQNRRRYHPITCQVVEGLLRRCGG
jgi:leukotriene-A4 hydrolase